MKRNGAPFLWNGCAVLAEFAAFFVKSKVAVVLMPFFMMLMMDYMDTHFWKNGEYSPVKFLQALPVQNDCYGWAVFLIGVVFFVITFGTMLHMEKKYEVL